jgi:signal transduction histidine kinase
LEVTASRLDDLVQRERAFAADASHQLSTPLTGLRYTLEAALLDPAPDHRQALADALAEVDRLQTTIQTLLAVKRDDTGASSTDLSEVVRDVATEWRPRLAAKTRELRTDLPPDLPLAGANQAVLGQVLRVLIENAHDHGSGTVTIRARAAGSGVVVEVEDEGPGIPAGVGDVFERRSSNARGHGIGLSLARSLTTAEGGRLLLQRAGPRPVFLLALPPPSAPVVDTPTAADQRP